MPVLLLVGCAPTDSDSDDVVVIEPQAAAPAVVRPALPPQQPESAPSAAPQPPQLSAQQRQIQALIQQVEEAYGLGQADYKKGHLNEAKTAFDRAVDLMLSSGIDIHANPSLQEEFDRIVDGVNALEMDALKQGNGFVSQEEPTPADLASDIPSEVTPVVDPNIVAKAKAELATTKSDLPLVVNDYVASYINFFANTTKGHNVLLHSFQRAGRYKAMIERVMADEGVPQDLIYLAVAESGFQPRALNRKSGAGGMWQFMPYGPYGLARTPYVDERFDPEKSTRAYARYMKFIYNQLGDWYLSMAGYDWGAGNIQHAVEKTGYADFWELYKRNNLPKETKVYVPEILAAIIIANNPTQYGFDDLTLDPPVLTDTVTINYSLDLRLASDLVGVPVDELVALNPSLLRLLTPPDASFDLHLPAGTAALFTDRIASIPQAKRNSWRYHRVVEGDTLASVARAYRVPLAALASANQMQEDDSLSGLEAVVVPVPPAPAFSTRTMLYVVRRGDTLVTIADRFGVSLAQLRRWNKISGIRVEPGRRLRVAEPSLAPRAAHRRRHAGADAQSGEKSTAKKPVTKKPTGAPTAHAHSGSAPTAARRKKSTGADTRTSSAAHRRKKSTQQN